jgi:glycosyltransferase involved in cell wall biosynthesis
MLSLGAPLPVLFLVTNFDRGGAEKILSRYALGLPREKYAVQVAALQGRSRAVAESLKGAGIPVHDLRMACRLDLLAPLRLSRLLRRARITVLFTFMFHPTILGRVVGRLCGVPLRISSERTMAWEGRTRRLLNRWTVPLATHVIAVSEAVAAYARQEFRIPPDRLTVIPNGVELDHFRPSPRPPGPRDPVVGCVAGLRPEHDHLTLVEAFARLASRLPRATLLLIGRGPEEARIRSTAAARGVVARVTFAGEQEDVSPFLHRMDLYAQASLTAGLPNAILEAMACGLPVVATAVGGTPEAVSHGTTGLLVPPRNPETFAGAMATVLEDAALAARFGLAGRARVEQLFSETMMLARFEGLVDQLIARHLGLRYQPAKGWSPC